jgi:hypothetical protein
MAGYEIIHVENKWIVCVEQTRLLSFDRKWKAMKVIQAVARLGDSPPPRSTLLTAGDGPPSDDDESP